MDQSFLDGMNQGFKKFLEKKENSIYMKIVKYAREELGIVLPLHGGDGTKRDPFIIGYIDPNDYLLYERVILDVMHTILGIEYTLKEQKIVINVKEDVHREFPGMIKNPPDCLDIIYIHRLGEEKDYKCYFNIDDCYYKYELEGLGLTSDDTKYTDPKIIYDDNLFHKVLGIHAFTHDKYDKDGYDIKGFNKKGFNKKFIHENGTLQNNDGYDRRGFNMFGWNKDGYDKRGFDGNGIHDNSTLYDDFGYDIRGFNKEGFDRNGINIDGTPWDNQGYDKDGYAYGYDREGYDRGGYDEEGYDRKGHDKEGFNEQNIHRSTGTIYNNIGFDKDGCHKDTGGKYNLAGVSQDGYYRNGKSIDDEDDEDGEVYSNIETDEERILRIDEKSKYTLKDCSPEYNDDILYDPEDENKV